MPWAVDVPTHRPALIARIRRPFIGSLAAAALVLGAAQLAERLRREIASRPIRFGADEIEGITASFGVAAGPEDSMTQIDLIASADAALYQAKRDGKNHVTVAEAW